MPAPSFVPEYPLSVVEFTGQRIDGDIRNARATDWHVVDRRGRTVRVFGPRPGYGWTLRKWEAEKYAARWNKDHHARV